MKPPVRLVLYGRGYCHLCDDMRAALAPFAARFGAEVTVVDVDIAGEADPALLARYDELVPVLTVLQVDGAERQLCHYFLDTAALEAFFHETQDTPGW